VRIIEKTLTYIETHRKIPCKRYSTRTEGKAHIFTAGTMARVRQNFIKLLELILTMMNDW
jgi:hypothetical protein